ncbi:MAG: sulfur reduction protein DsrE [Nitrospirae bacterium]|nr:MAG: sulfur reduction protein DsrE [Nitrospirota bacterium]
MKLGIVIYSKEPETVWNAFRFANFSTKQGDTVRVFLLGGGVEAVNIDDERFNVKEQIEAFVSSGGEVLSCGTCLQIRKQDAPPLSPVSTLEESHEIVQASERILTC